ncbi:MAG: lactate utilization protein B/C, partial [Chitinophagaceae bacterium]
MTSNSKENILKKIRKALSNPVPLPFAESEGSSSVFTESTEDDAIVFAEEFTKLGGRFAFCENEQDLLQQLSQLFKEQGWTKIYCTEPAYINQLNSLSIQPYHSLPDCDASVTGCEYLVARTGSMVLSSAQISGRTTSVYAPVHICIAYNSQLLFDVKDALQFM